MVYLDHAATTPLRPEAVSAMQACLDEAGEFANPASGHAPGRRAARLLEEARERFAAVIGASPAELVFTSGATESNNLALLGAAAFYGDERPRIVMPKTEHKSVLDPCRQLAGRGFRLHHPPLDAEGVLTPEALVQALDKTAGLAACMLVNNETGVIQNIPAMAQACQERQVILHVDAAQALGKLPIHCRRWGVGMMSFSAHKFGGPKGIGALYLRRKPAVRVQPLVYGGGHEQGLRLGTVALHQIVAMVAAAEAAVTEQEREFARLAGLREALWQQLDAALPGLLRNGSSQQQAPHILNISFEGVDGEALRADLPELALSSGSACTSANAESSYVLRALGRNDALADASLRFSFGTTTTAADIKSAAEQVIQAVRRLRRLSPLWEAAA